jgi:hypothetical protein
MQCYLTQSFVMIAELLCFQIDRVMLSMQSCLMTRLPSSRYFISISVYVESYKVKKAERFSAFSLWSQS